MKITKKELRNIIREEIQNLTNSFLFEKKIKNYDIQAGFLGNGITVVDKNREEHGDYKKIAHISEDGTKITWYDKKLPGSVKTYIGSIAKYHKQSKNHL